MVVGEPSLMGGEFGDEDERLITRLENTQYDSTSNPIDHDNSHRFSESPLTGSGPGPPSNTPNPVPNSWVGTSSGPSSGVCSAQNSDPDKKSPALN